MASDYLAAIIRTGSRSWAQPLGVAPGDADGDCVGVGDGDGWGLTSMVSTESDAVSWLSTSEPSITVPKRLYRSPGPAPGQINRIMKNWLPFTGCPGARAIPNEPTS